MTTPTDIEEMKKKLEILQLRQREAYRAGGISARPEALEAKDLDDLQDAYEMLDDFGKLVVDLRQDVWVDFAKGARCGVCGNTSEQSRAKGYDCATRC